jgi:hypothetical protein
LYVIEFSYDMDLRNVMDASLDRGATLQGHTHVSHADTPANGNIRFPRIKW